MLTRPPTQFYRVTSANKRFELDVGEPMPEHGGARHRLYGEISGNPNGPAVVCLHGGPGAGSNPATRQFIDPDHYCIVQFDQRGAGRSQPWASMVHNTTPHLVEDINSVADHLGLKNFILFGGSWGSTLALAYINQFPHRVKAMVLRGIFLGRPQDIEWFLWGVRGVHPEAHAAFAQFLPPSNRQSAADILSAYVDRLTSSEANIADSAAYAWARYEDAIATLADNKARESVIAQFLSRRALGKHASLAPSKPPAMHYALAIARAEAFYLQNKLFLPPDGLLARSKEWNSKPGVIVHGRYDMVCQVEGATALSTAWPAADLHIIDDAGHSTFEEGIARALLDAMEKLKQVR